MRKISYLLVCLLFIALPAEARPYYGRRFCKIPGFHCIRVKGVVKNWVALKSETWESLWPDERERGIVKRLNRLHKWLFPRMLLAVPDNMAGKTHMDFLPLPKELSMLQLLFSEASAEELRTVPPEENGTATEIWNLIKDIGKEKVVIWSPALFAWAAYNEEGRLVNWGPGLGGKDYCPDIKRECRTPSGVFEALAQKGEDYWSNLYPPGCKGEECSWMPHYVRVREDGLGMHGAEWFVGWHASHGCVRLFTADAKWLNEKFFDYKTKEHPGTKVIFLPYPK